MDSPKMKIAINRREVVLVLVIILGLYVLLPQFSSFRNSWGMLSNLKLNWVVSAAFFTLATYFFAALTYLLLSLYRLRYSEVVIVQYAAMLVNRILPAGVGALGANYAYLHHRKHSATQAATVVATNNLMGIVGHTLIIIVVLLFSSQYSRHLAAHSEHKLSITIQILFAVVAGLILIGLIVGRSKLKRTLASIRQQIVVYKRHPMKLSGALLSSMALTLCNVLCLYSCMYALGVHLPIIVVVLIFTLGLGAGTATPTPGGLGGFEAGLAAGFVAYHIDFSSALAIALLFRLVSYWFTLVIGIFAFIVSQQKHLFDI